VGILEAAGEAEGDGEGGVGVGEDVAEGIVGDLFLHLTPPIGY